MPRRVLSGLLALLFLLVCLPVSSEMLAPRPVLRALLVACDDFVSMADTTPSSYNNLIAIRQALLRDSRGYRGIRVSLNQALDAEGFARLAAQAFEGAAEGDISLLYLSTHGLLNETGDDFIALMSDGAEERLLDGAAIHAALEPVPGTKVIIVDACYSGALINKGMDSPLPSSRFGGRQYKVLTSAGGREPSFLWVDSAGQVRGGSYFARALAEGISARGRFAADFNRDGVITLGELHDYQLRAYGASTPQAYPQRDDFPVLVYDPSSQAIPFTVTGLELETSAFHVEGEPLWFSYTLHRTSRLAYQLVYERAGSWRFQQPQSIMEPGRGDGVVLPGRKAAALTVQPGLLGLSGYALLLLVTVQEDLSTPETCVLLSVQQGEADPELALEGLPAFSPQMGEEAAFILRHKGALTYSADILDENGAVVCSLARGQMSRPLHLQQEGSCLWWDGRTDTGEWAPPGAYRLRVSARSGGRRHTIIGEAFRLNLPEEGVQAPGY